jgi:hypothetical protein
MPVWVQERKFFKGSGIEAEKIPLMKTGLKFFPVLGLVTRLFQFLIMSLPKAIIHNLTKVRGFKNCPIR